MNNLIVRTTERMGYAWINPRALMGPLPPAPEPTYFERCQLGRMLFPTDAEVRGYCMVLYAATAKRAREYQGFTGQVWPGPWL